MGKKIQVSVDVVWDWWSKLCAWLLHKRRHRATHLAVIEDGHEVEDGEMGKPLANTDTRELFLVPKDDQQKVDSIQPGTMTAASSDESKATVALDPADELRAVITPVDGAAADEVVFTFTADADLGQGVAQIVGTYSCAIVDKLATVIDVTEGEDTPKP